MEKVPRKVDSFVIYWLDGERPTRDSSRGLGKNGRLSLREVGKRKEQNAEDCQRINTHRLHIHNTCACLPPENFYFFATHFCQAFCLLEGFCFHFISALLRLYCRISTVLAVPSCSVHDDGWQNSMFEVNVPCQPLFSSPTTPLLGSQTTNTRMRLSAERVFVDFSRIF